MANSCLNLSQAARFISTPLGRDARPSQVTPLQVVRFPQQFARTHLYSWLKRGTVRVKCPAQEYNTIAVVTPHTFALGKLDLLTVLPRETLK